MISPDLAWWISVIEAPVIAGIIAFMLHQENKFQRAITEISREITSTQLSIAKEYAPQDSVRALEDRLTAHLLRIERKLDTTALQTATLRGESHDRT